MESYSNQLRSFHLNLKCNSCEIFVVFCCVQCLTITNVPIFSAILAAYILLDDKDKYKSTIHCCYRILLYGRSMLTRSFKIWTTHFEMYFLARLALTGQFCARGILEFQNRIIRIFLLQQYVILLHMQDIACRNLANVLYNVHRFTVLVGRWCSEKCDC